MKTNISNSDPIIRIADLALSIILLPLLGPMALIVYGICLLSLGSGIFSQTRIGLEEKKFTLYKFRTMPIDTPCVATHELKIDTIRPWLKLIRALRLDEIPQLINVLKGDMSLVGYRPSLPTQKTLNILRRENRLFDHKPGVTGLAQAVGVDMSTPVSLIKFDLRMVQNFGIGTYLRILLMTLCRIIFKKTH